MVQSSNTGVCEFDHALEAFPETLLISSNGGLEASQVLQIRVPKHSADVAQQQPSNVPDGADQRFLQLLAHNVLICIGAPYGRICLQPLSKSLPGIDHDIGGGRVFRVVSELWRVPDANYADLRPCRYINGGLGSSSTCALHCAIFCHSREQVASSRGLEGSNLAMHCGALGTGKPDHLELRLLFNSLWLHVMEQCVVQKRNLLDRAVLLGAWHQCSGAFVMVTVQRNADQQALEGAVPCTVPMN